MKRKQAEVIRNKAMETWDETNKRRKSSSSDSSSDGMISPKRSRTPRGSGTRCLLENLSRAGVRITERRNAIKKGRITNTKKAGRASVITTNFNSAAVGSTKPINDGHHEKIQ